MTAIERRYLPAEACPVEVREENGQPVIHGYASVFYVEGDAGTEYQLFPDLKERIMPRAFNRALQEKHDAACLFNHDPNLILGRVSSGTLRLSKDQRGLRYEAKPPKSRADVVESIQRGDVAGSSFAFRVLEQKFRTETGEDGKPVDIREIHSVILEDASPVLRPAYSGTTTGIRAIGDTNEARAAYDAWKSEQASAAEAEASKRARIQGYLDRAASVQT